MCFPTRSALVVALLVCLVAPAALIVAHIHENPEFSPIDEAEHWDYVTRIANGGFPRLGQFVQPTTLRAQACRGTALPGFNAPPCKQRILKPAEFSGGDYTYEAQQPPVYYAATVPMRWVAMNVFRMGDVDGTRAAGIVWLCAGLFVMWIAGRLVELRPLAIGAAVLLIGSGPLVVYEESSITNSAASILAGSFLFLLAALAWRHPGRWVIPVLGVGAFVVVAIDQSNALAIIVASAMFGALVTCGSDASAPGEATSVRTFLRAWWPAGGALLIGALASAGAWIAVSRELAIINPKILPAFGALRTTPRGLGEIFREAVAMLGPVTDSYNVYRPTITSNNSNMETVINEGLRTLWLAGALAALFVHRRLWYHWMGLVSVATLYVGGVVLGVGLWLNYDIDPSLTGRYGLSVAPFLALGLVAAIRGRWALGALWVVGLVTFATTLWYTLVG